MGKFQKDPERTARVFEMYARNGTVPRARIRYEMPLYEIAQRLRDSHLEVPAHIQEVLVHCGSAAELAFVGEFASRTGVGVVDHRCLRLGATDVRLQGRERGYMVDLMVERNGFKLAVELDGMGFHHTTDAQVARDYARERRLVLSGCTVIRFTAAEVFGHAKQAWVEVFRILEVRADA